MLAFEDPFSALDAPGPAEQATPGDSDFARLAGRPFTAKPPATPGTAAVVARLQGFDLLEQPLLNDLPASPGLVLPARSTVALHSAMVGSQVLVLFENADLSQPIVIGVLQAPESRAAACTPGFSVQADDTRHVITAEREIVLRCGDASITLTRAGKVIIQGRYVLSRSSGCNKIKGASIDLN